MSPLNVCLVVFVALLGNQRVHSQIPNVFKPDPEKIDMLVVVAHPDDEGTFGGLLPYYAVCRDKKIKLMVLTSGEWGNGLPHHASSDQEPDYSYDDSDHPRFEEVPEDALYPCYFRETEMSRVLLMSGVHYAPIMPRLKDMSGIQPWGTPEGAFGLWGGREKVIELVAKEIRRFRPEVVVTMAEDGFNRNPQHMAASVAAREAVSVAAIGGSQTNEEPWLVKKLYTVVTNLDDPVEGANPDASLIEGIEDNLHDHQWDLSCDRLKVTAQIRAASANALHRSQEMPDACPAESRFILQHSTVGPDLERRNDLFENIAQSP
ncbi:MAG: PIG-L family deacetylase [Planctomycetota bacterium]